MTKTYSIGDTVKVSEDYPVREFAGVEGVITNMGASCAVLESEDISGEFSVFIEHLEAELYVDEDSFREER